MSAFGISVSEGSTCIFKDPISKREALDRLVDAVSSTGAVKNVEAFRRAVHERESIMSTGIGQGIAIPHVRAEAITTPTVGVAVAPRGIDYDTLDNEPVYVIVMFAMPAGAQKEYLGLLAQVMQALKDKNLKDRLLACNTAAEVLVVLDED